MLPYTGRMTTFLGGIADQDYDLSTIAQLRRFSEQSRRRINDEMREIGKLLRTDLDDLSRIETAW